MQAKPQPRGTAAAASPLKVAALPVSAHSPAPASSRPAPAQCFHAPAAPSAPLPQPPCRRWCTSQPVLPRLLRLFLSLQSDLAVSNPVHRDGSRWQRRPIQSNGHTRSEAPQSSRHAMPLHAPPCSPQRQSNGRAPRGLQAAARLEGLACWRGQQAGGQAGRQAGRQEAGKHCCRQAGVS